MRSYILREFGFTLLPIIFLLTFFLLFGMTITEVLDYDVPITAIGRVGMWLIPEVLTYTIPMSFLLACLMSFGRMASDREILSIRSAGVNVVSLCIPINLVALLVTLFMVGLNATFLPHLRHKSLIAARRMAALYPVQIIPEGQMIEDAFDGMRLYVEKKDPRNNKLYNVTLEKSDPSGKLIVIQAVSAEIAGSVLEDNLHIILRNVSITEAKKGQEDTLYKGDFRVWDQKLDIKDAVMNPDIEMRPGDYNIMELLDRVRNYEDYAAQEKGRERRDIFRAELHEKISRPFCVFVFSLVGIPLAIGLQTGGKSTSFAYAFAIFAVYYLLLVPGQALSEKGVIPASLGMWFSNILLATVGVVLYTKIATE